MSMSSLASRVWKRLFPERPYGIVPKEKIAVFVPASPVIVEAGAHIGTDTVELATQFPTGTIHAFEPVPELFSQLKERTGGLKNVRCYPLALSSQSGKAKMYVSSGGSDASSSLLSPKEHLNDHPEVFFSSEIEVDCISLDQWAETYKVPKIDFLWLDLQGHEMNVLKASPNAMKGVKVVYTEIQLKEAYAGTQIYPIYKDWLKSQGFRVQQEEIPWEDAGNVLFVRNKA